MEAKELLRAWSILGCIPVFLLMGISYLKGINTNARWVIIITQSIVLLSQIVALILSRIS